MLRLCCTVLRFIKNDSYFTSYQSAVSLKNKSSFISVVQPLRAFGKVENKDSIYWDGLAECYNRGLVKNVGVW